MVLNGTGLFFLTPVSPVPLYQTSFLTSINQSSDHQFIIKGKLQLLTHFLQERENGSWFRLLSYKKEIMATPPGMPQATPPATPPAILFQISKIFNFSNNLPQAMPLA
ncbi:hypothetical protein T01_15000 [Trichinella spiralis]|uniref:Uncharacterized protein n=1 Tax=Trichinella spiralis TaxID=6334 RepID=A0A0V1ANS8_TRISP|nr:hypothetical protein T01_15000 [Trichinella spiralis]